MQEKTSSTTTSNIGEQRQHDDDGNGNDGNKDIEQQQQSQATQSSSSVVPSNENDPSKRDQPQQQEQQPEMILSSSTKRASVMGPRTRFGLLSTLIVMVAMAIIVTVVVVVNNNKNNHNSPSQSASSNQNKKKNTITWNMPRSRFDHPDAVVWKARSVARAEQVLPSYLWALGEEHSIQDNTTNDIDNTTTTTATMTNNNDNNNTTTTNETGTQDKEEQEQQDSPFNSQNVSIPLFWFAHSIRLSADATRLVVSTTPGTLDPTEVNGMVQVFHYRNTDTNTTTTTSDNFLEHWTIEAEWWGPPTTATTTSNNNDPIKISQFWGKAITLAGNGQYLAVGAGGWDARIEGNIQGQVWTFDWKAASDNSDDNNNGSWQLHGQPILEMAVGDATGSSVGMNYDGSLLAVGAPRAAGRNVHAGQVRFYQKQANTYWQFLSDVRGTSLNSQVGGSLTLSADGTTLADGDILANTPDGGFGSGVVWVWRREDYGNDDDDDNNNNNKNDPPTWSRLGQPISGSVVSGHFGRRIALSANGNVLASFQERTILVYEYHDVSDTTDSSWQPRGAPISVQSNTTGWLNVGLCLAQDGNLLVVSTSDMVAVYQFQETTVGGAGGPSKGVWIKVGRFEHENEDYNNETPPFGSTLACSADGHVFVTARTGYSMTVWEASA